MNSLLELAWLASTGNENAKKSLRLVVATQLEAGMIGREALLIDGGHTRTYDEVSLARTALAAADALIAESGVLE